MREHLARFFTALGYFTRLPAPAWVTWSPDRLARAAAYLPLVGWVVGIAGATALYALALVLPASLAVILSMALTIRLTGALHEDGFADACDGLGGGWDKAQILAIMKDSRIGSYGAIGIVLMLLAKAAALVELAAISPATAAIALLVTHPLSRLAATAVLHALPYARSDDSSKAGGVTQRLSRVELALVGASGLLPALVFLTFMQTLVTLVLAALVTLWLARSFLRRLGGHTGDLLGAVQQAVELACYTALLVGFGLAG
jgi:adenosylcobinamide-GDP ribazoletransferase